MKLAYIEIFLMVLLIGLLIYFFIEERKDHKQVVDILTEINNKTK